MEQFFKGGAFLIESISPQDVFTPEDFSEEEKESGSGGTSSAQKKKGRPLF